MQSTSTESVSSESSSTGTSAGAPSSPEGWRWFPERASVLGLLREAGPTWLLPALFLGTLLIYGGLAWDRLGAPSPDNHFVYLADSYLNGTLEMRHDPPHGNDWASVDTLRWEDGRELRGVWQDRRARVFRDLGGELHTLEPRELRVADQSRTYFVSFPPFPAVLMLPGVWLRGFDFSDVHFTIFFAALNVLLIHLFLTLLRLRGYTGRSWKDNLWITAFFALGSVHLWCSVLGQVWFTALVVGVTFSLLYLMAALDGRYPFLAGLFLACAFSTRTTLLFATVFFAFFLVWRSGRWRMPTEDTVKRALVFGLVPLVVGGLLMWANWLRFGSLSEFGHTYLAAGQMARIRDYGLFHPIFINRNLASMFALVPFWTPDDSWFRISRHGLALWFTMPVLLWAVLVRPAENARVAGLRMAMWATVAVIAIPHLLYQNTGWEQFSYRFAMDYLPCLVVLLALSGRRHGWLFAAALIWGVLVNGFGALTFKRLQEWYVNGWFPFS